MAGLVGAVAVGLIAGIASKKKERPNQLPLIGAVSAIAGAVSAIAVYFGLKLLSNRSPSADGNSNASGTESNGNANVDEAGNQPENNTDLESLQAKEDRGESGSAPLKEEQDGPFLSKSEGLNSVCKYLTTDDWKHHYSAISSDSPVSLPWSSHSSFLLNSELVEGNETALLGSTSRSDISECADNGATRGHSKIRSGVDADLARALSSSSLSSTSLESNIEIPHDIEGVSNASPDIRLHAYDEYLSDPCLSPSLRSQVLRAKSIVQRLHKP